jgi:hypothetical protein
VRGLARVGEKLKAVAGVFALALQLQGQRQPQKYNKVECE